MSKAFYVVKGYNGRKFDLVINTHSQKPSGDSLVIPVGDVIVYDDTAPNGNVWFYYNGQRGKSESGSLENMLNAGVIAPAHELINNEGKNVYVHPDLYNVLKQDYAKGIAFTYVKVNGVTHCIVIYENFKD